jgi:hypothetical protein
MQRVVGIALGYEDLIYVAVSETRQQDCDSSLIQRMGRRRMDVRDPGVVMFIGPNGALSLSYPGGSVSEGVRLT